MAMKEDLPCILEGLGELRSFLQEINEGSRRVFRRLVFVGEKRRKKQAEATQHIEGLPARQDVKELVGDCIYIVHHIRTYMLNIEQALSNRQPLEKLIGSGGDFVDTETT